MKGYQWQEVKVPHPDGGFHVIRTRTKGGLAIFTSTVCSSRYYKIFHAPSGLCITDYTDEPGKLSRAVAVVEELLTLTDWNRPVEEVSADLQKDNSALLKKSKVIIARRGKCK